MGDYAEHLISMAGGDGDSGGGIAEVLAAHWSRSTFTNYKPHVDKCDGCGTVIYTWGDDPIPGGIEPLASHQGTMLTAAGFGKLS